MFESVKLETSMSQTTDLAAKPSGVTALAVSVPVIVSAEVASSTPPTFEVVADSIAIVTVSAPSLTETSIPSPAVIT